jgi:hypothetical protein
MNAGPVRPIIIVGHDDSAAARAAPVRRRSGTHQQSLTTERRLVRAGRLAHIGGSHDNITT